MCMMFHAADYLQSVTDIHVHESIVRGECNEHTHDFIELGLVLGGEGIHIIEQKAYPIKSGEIFLLDAYVSHSLIAEEENEISVRNCLFEPSAIGMPIEYKKNFVNCIHSSLFSREDEKRAVGNYLRLSGSHLYDIAILFNDINQEYNQKDAGFDFMLRSDLSKLLVQMFRLYEKAEKGVDRNEQPHEQMISESVNYLRAHCSDNITGEDLANRYYLSTSYFNRIFREITGCSVTQMQQKFRMEAAQDRLDHTNATITEIASEVGYRDMKNFYKIFRKFYGCTPKQYRDRYLATEYFVS